MKIALLPVLILSSLLTGCVVPPVVSDPGYPPGPVVGPGPVQSPGETYRIGESRGRDDRRDGRSYYPGRYRERVAPGLWGSFTSGYERGYRSYVMAPLPVIPGPGPGPVGYEHTVYQNGHRAGEMDRLRGLPPNYRRHMGEFPLRFEEVFRRGYQAGWH